jgi:hypothetical protein
MWFLGRSQVGFLCYILVDVWFFFRFVLSFHSRFRWCAVLSSLSSFPSLFNLALSRSESYVHTSTHSLSLIILF